MKKLMFLTGSRGEWGYIRPILRLIEKRDDVDYRLVVTNMHLLPTYGNSYREIEKDGFKIHYKIHMSLDGYSHTTMAKSLGICLMELPDILDNEKPDWFILAGDRGEQLMGAIAAGYTYTPVAHIQAGEVSGNIDNLARHAIGKFVHMHFASNVDAASRLKKLGEEDFRIHNVGAPQLDEMINSTYSTPDEVESHLGIELPEKFILAVMHPVTEEYYRTKDQAKIFVKSLNAFDCPKIVIMSNNDAGAGYIRQALDKYKKGEYYLFANMKRQDYLTLLKNCLCIVGNSSSGLLEAPTFRTPAVNIGRRQNLRYRGNNVIDVEFDENQIIDAMNKASSKEFHDYLKRNVDNPYGDGHSSERILDLLINTNIDEKFLTKQLTF